MRIAAALMATGLALYEAVENHNQDVEIASPEGDDELAENVRKKCAHLADVYETFKIGEIRRGTDEREAMQAAMKVTARRHKAKADHRGGDR